jgi:hypothetical protein
MIIKKSALFCMLCLFFSGLVWAEEVFILTDQLQFSSSQNLTKARGISPTKEITLFKKISEKNGVTKLLLFQLNGNPRSETVYISSKWFARGTRGGSIESFKVDPNNLLNAFNKNINCEYCQANAGEEEQATRPNPKIDNAYVTGRGNDSCSILKSNSQNISEENNEEKYLDCFDSIIKKINISYQNSAYKTISKLYLLPPEQQIFMARILTMYGEASGAIPPEEQMAAVLQVVNNRTRVAQEKYPKINQLDVVLQNSQFSMFNPKDSNWKRALFASRDKVKEAVHVLANPAKYIMKDTKGHIENIFHFMTPNLCHYKFRPSWIKSCEEKSHVKVNDVKLNSPNGHIFFANIPWAFNPKNRYKEYARQHGGIR